MARPHIEFIQSQRLPWVPANGVALGEGAEIKVLSEDGETGAASLLVRVPAGWRIPAGASGADEEFLILEGELRVGDALYRHLGYAHWPAGYIASERSSRDGVTMLMFISADRRRPPPTSFDRARLVEHVDAYAIAYTGNFHPEFPAGAGRKVLFSDPTTKATSWLLGTLPVRWAERAEEHDDVEEMYLLSGESHGDRGVMRPGAYFWRPGRLRHGPYGTLTGNLYFFRSIGGPLVTRYVQPETPFRWWPPYRPALPPHLIAFAGESPPGPRPW